MEELKIIDCPPVEPFPFPTDWEIICSMCVIPAEYMTVKPSAYSQALEMRNNFTLSLNRGSLKQ